MALEIAVVVVAVIVVAAWGRHAWVRTRAESTSVEGYEHAMGVLAGVSGRRSTRRAGRGRSLPEARGETLTETIDLRATGDAADLRATGDAAQPAEA
ncbi:MAG: hypothetical protein ACRDYD_06000, partial [Acidimicrobiales bacterium]